MYKSQHYEPTADDQELCDRCKPFTLAQLCDFLGAYYCLVDELGEHARGNAPHLTPKCLHESHVEIINEIETGVE